MQKVYISVERIRYLLHDLKSIISAQHTRIMQINRQFVQVDQEITSLKWKKIWHSEKYCNNRKKV